jgi:hypothetical protein
VVGGWLAVRRTKYAHLLQDDLICWAPCIKKGVAERGGPQEATKALVQGQTRKLGIDKAISSFIEVYAQASLLTDECQHLPYLCRP